MTYRSDLLANQLRSIDELLVGRRFTERLGQAFNSQLPHSGSNSHRFNTIAPEELVTEEGLDDCRDAGYG